MYLVISWMKFCFNCTIDLSTCWGIQPCQKMSVWMKWPLARVQVSTCTFCKFDLTALLGLISRSQICFSFVNGDFQSVQISSLADSESESCKIWILDWLKITIHKRKSYLRPRDQPQQSCQNKFAKSACGHLHACKWPLHPNWHFLAWLYPSAYGHVTCAFRTKFHQRNHQLYQVLRLILDKVLLNLHFLTI